VTDDLRALAIHAGDPASPVILHVPHASRLIPADVRSGLFVDDDELAAELDRMTDTDTDVIARLAASTAATSPWLFLNPYTRLVVDPERLPDEREDMLAVGMGPVYTRTSSGGTLRDSADPLLRERYYEPYGLAFTDLVDERLDLLGEVVIIDVHSYPSQRLPYERGGTARPEICIGTDDTHTPLWLRTVARGAFSDAPRSAENTPFAGCYVPLKHYCG
jgi:N-formylglutamate amidohydrolase